MDLSRYPVTPNKLVAKATDKYLTPKTGYSDPTLPIPATFQYGQDVEFGLNRAAPEGHNVGKTEAELKPKMEALLGVFAGSDSTGMAKRLFAEFLKKRTVVGYFDDPSLTQAAINHPNIKYWMDAAVGGPGLKQPNTGVKRIHQALKDANWDISKLNAPTDLGVPAFNNGNKIFSTGDFGNGLGLMINGVQYVTVVATHYYHDKSAGQYQIKLLYHFYDVFGLDDDDLKEFGDKTDSAAKTIGGGILGGIPGAMIGNKLRVAGVGITAWWQLQHQFNYAPLITRIRIVKEYTLRTT